MGLIESLACIRTVLLSVRIGGTDEIANVYLDLLHGFRSRAHLTVTENNRNPQTLFNQFKALAVLSSVLKHFGSN